MKLIELIYASNQWHTTNAMWEIDNINWIINNFIKETNKHIVCKRIHKYKETRDELSNKLMRCSGYLKKPKRERGGGGQQKKKEKL